MIEYFKNFDMERICIDKVFFLVYDQEYATQDHHFDLEMKDRFVRYIKRSRIKKGRFEEVLRKENDYSSWELQLRGPRVMYFHVNVIHYLQAKHGIKPKNVIYDDNFLDIDSKINLLDHIEALREFIDKAKGLYKKVVNEYWNEDLKKIDYKIVQIEVPFEVYPASVDDIAKNLYATGVAFRKYNTQSGTIYLTTDKADNEITADRKYDKVSKIDNKDLTPDIVYLNKINSGRNENKIQIKIYQKTFGLCRIEFTLYSDDAKRIFKFLHTNDIIQDDVISFIHHSLWINGIRVDRYDRSLDDVVQFVAKAMRESEDLIYSLKNVDVYESCYSNRQERQRLVRKGILLKKYDSDSVQQKGIYQVNPLIRDFLNLYEATGNEHFVQSLYPEI